MEGVVFFFFSSRRRHTRYWRDWSSDVCSSDLRGWIKTRGKARTDSSHVLAAIRQLNRIECCGETLRCVLNDLATVAPQWLLAQVTSDWFDRYGVRFEQYRLPKTKTEQQQLALTIGEDGHHLLAALYENSTIEWLKQIPTV